MLFSIIFTFTGDKIDVKETASHTQLPAVTEFAVDYFDARKCVRCRHLFFVIEILVLMSMILVQNLMARYDRSRVLVVTELVVTALFTKPPASRFPAVPGFDWYYSIIPLFQP